MSLIARELMKLEAMDREMKSGKYETDQMKYRLWISQQVCRFTQLSLQVAQTESSFGPSAVEDMKKAGLIDDEPVLSLEDAKQEEIYCPALCGDITRKECADYSASGISNSACEECENYLGTRRQLKLAELADDHKKVLAEAG